MRKCCINSGQKIQHRKVNQNLLFLTGKLVPLQKSIAYVLLCSSAQSSKNDKERSGFCWVFVHFPTRKTDHLKNIKNQQSNIPSGLPKGLKLQETKENMLSTCVKWSKRERKGVVRVMAFAQKCRVALTHHHGNFLNSGSSGCFLSCLCAPGFICHTYLHEPLLPVTQISVIPNKK